MTAAATSRANAQHAKFMCASQSSKLTRTSASVAAYKGQPGTTIRLGISNGAGMCHGSALRRHNAADLKTCSAASIGSAISTTTAGGGDGTGGPNTVDLRAPLLPVHNGGEHGTQARSFTDRLRGSLVRKCDRGL